MGHHCVQKRGDRFGLGGVNDRRAQRRLMLVPRFEWKQIRCMHERTLGHELPDDFAPDAPSGTEHDSNFSFETRHDFL